MKIELDGSKRNKGHVFIYQGGELIAKFWFYGDGSVKYREWKLHPTEHIEITDGETLVFKPQSSGDNAQ